ncbi:MAG: prephenate dehydratase [Flavobacteriaceae bacterium]
MHSNEIIGIQGIRGSFHDEVARVYFSEASSLREFLSFGDLALALEAGEISHAVMAIENSIAGSIIPNYALIDQNDLHIVGEHYLSINHHLMALEGQTIEAIEEVRSHPMALLQCKQFFKQFPHIRLVETADTAEEAKKITMHKTKAVAAIASQQAAQIYGLSVLASSIQTIKNNITRFVVLEKNKPTIEEEKINKAALKFTLDHQRGSLAAVLNMMSDCLLNLTKIQSLPVIETPGKYAFFVDVTFDTYAQFAKAKSILQIMASEFKILGEYTNQKE